MCGLFGNLSGDYKQFMKLYQKNRERGDFAFGAFMTHIKKSDDITSIILRTEGEFTMPGNYEITMFDQVYTPDNFRTLLGHTQAPTSAKRSYSRETSHPFECGDWVVAHNGVLTNDRILAKKLHNQSSYNEVDSSVIPAMFSEHSSARAVKDDVETICNCLSQIEGTLGLWIYNYTSRSIYLARSGSTLFCNHLTNEFSSTREPKMEELAEGTLYQLTVEGCTAVGKFRSNSPFFL